MAEEMEKGKEVEKPYNEKNVIERHTVVKEDGTYQFQIGSALLEQDARITQLMAEVKQLKEAMGFLATWWEEKHGTGLILPSTSTDLGTNKPLTLL